ncbi:MAG: hypothetical protein AUH86_25155 [Acidobacteria bacterium 13_1_40CM_4_58_4]|nr:MAG: hypothetical protein AUH86_25155 [Acidobacteria bacterium 13_1_40CM_4_58_4]
MARKNRFFRDDCAPLHQLLNQRFRAFFCALWRKRPWRPSMPRQVRHKNPQVLVRETLCDIPHDPFRGGYSMQKYDKALRVTGTRLDHIHAHLTPARAG